MGVVLSGLAQKSSTVEDVGMLLLGLCYVGTERMYNTLIIYLYRRVVFLSSASIKM